MEIVPLPCFHHFTDGHSLSLYPSREICRSCITEIVPFPCFHCFIDGHNLSLSMQSPIDREICRSCIIEIYHFCVCTVSWMDIASLSHSIQSQYLQSLLAPNTPLTPLTPPDAPKHPPTPLGTPNAPDANYTPSGPWVPRVPASPQ